MFDDIKPEYSRSDCQNVLIHKVETILHSVLKFQSDRACFQGEVFANFGGKERREK